MKPKVGMIGTGYAGLVTGACFAELGFEVLCGDIDQKKVDLINRGIPPIFETGLADLLKDLRDKNLLRATTDTSEVVQFSDIIFICTGTPSTEDGSINLDQIEAASKDIARALKDAEGFKIIVVKSTVIPGITENFVKPLLERFSGKQAGVDFGLAMNPEFLKEGLAIQDFRVPDRVVIGTEDEKSFESVKILYESFTCPIMHVDTSTAEMIKYASNAFLAIKVSFINEIANMSEVMGADVSEVARGLGFDKRISPQFLRPGLGFGGSCFPKDVKALASAAKSHGISAHTLDAALKVNESQPLRAVEMLEEEINLENKKIALLGIAFKPDTDDVRESRVIPIAEELIRKGATVIAYDPLALENAKYFLPETSILVDNVNAALRSADAAILVTEWDELRNLGPEEFSSMSGKLIIDGRRVLDWKKLSQAGFTVKVIGNVN
ncbi:MAG: UDP-glucose/GDP-mannose dehydrogenase family protein [Candidatus Heimdallarchaeota archaeon]|nr:UDP-glucose/GDP-mannose dehydrogenase family protein [Candidatus Heimdallarchaeota archaeon]